MPSWTPLKLMKHGKVVLPFLPMDHPSLLKLSANYCNIYPGDELYIFEENGDWGRGYIISQSNPSDFASAVVNLNKLVDHKIRVVIFPLSHIRVLDSLEPTGKQSKTAGTHKTSDKDDDKVQYRRIPKLPYLNRSIDLLNELNSANAMLTSHIYAMYSLGEFRLFNKLISLYNEIADVRLSLSKKTFTLNEEARFRKHASLLLTKIPKILAAAEKYTEAGDEDNQRIVSDADVSGYRSIMARNPKTGELMDFASDNLSTTPCDIAMNQVLYALSGSYPLNSLEASLEPASGATFDSPLPSNIMVDLEAVSGSVRNVPTGFKGMVAYLYLRNKKVRLTEAFAIRIGSGQKLLLENVSAALFKNIPSSEVDNNGKVYLVAILTELIDITGFNRKLKTITKGLAAGVTDVSRVFSRHKGALASGESHKFTIKLYGSFINHEDNTAKLAATTNNGWGDLVDRIIQGSSVGVAVNPRAEGLTVSVKELATNSALDENFQISHETALTPVRTLFYDSSSNTNERVYLRLNKIIVDEAQHPLNNTYLTVHIDITKTKLHIGAASNQASLKYWECVSVVPEETLGEVLLIGGFDELSFAPTAEQSIKFLVYSNAELIAEERISLLKDGIVKDTKGSELVLSLKSSSGPVKLNFSIDYIGTNFNIDPSLKVIMDKARGDTKLKDNIELTEAIKKITRTNMQQLIRFFSKLIASLFQIFEDAELQNDCSNQTLIFDSIVHILDVVFARNDQYVYLFDEFCLSHKNTTTAGAGLLKQVSAILDTAETNWSQGGRQFCRVSAFFIKMIVACNKETHVSELSKSVQQVNSRLVHFFSLTEVALVPEQIVLLDNSHYYFQAISAVQSDTEVWLFVSGMLESIGTRGLGEADTIMSTNHQRNSSSLTKVKLDLANALIAKKKKDEHGLVVAKLMLMRRISHGDLVQSETVRDNVISNLINWSLEVLSSSYDAECSRLAAGVVAKCFDVVWKETVLVENGKDWYLVRSITRLIPVLAKIFVKYNKYCRVHGLFVSKRTFTKFFQLKYPFEDHTMDSIVTKETFVELLIELCTLVSFATKFSKHCVKMDDGYDSIACFKEDEFFIKSSHYAKTLSISDIVSMVQFCKIVYDAQFFPSKKWLSLYSMFLESSFTMLELMKFNMVSQLIPPSEKTEDFNTSLSGNYLRLILRISTSRPAATSQLSDILREGCDKIVGDLQTRGASLLEEVWNELGWDSIDDDASRFNLARFTGYQSEFLGSEYSIVGDLVVFFLQKNDRCQAVGAYIFWTVMASECILNDDGLVELSKETIKGLYDMYHSNGYRPSIDEIERFLRFLNHLIKVDPNDVAYKQIFSFIENLTRFLYTLNDLANVPLSDEFDDERTFHRVNILGFLLNVDQPELLYEFIDDMYQSNIQKGNFVQAALNLNLLAKTYDWTLHVLLPESKRPYFPQQTPFKRKEALYRLIGSNLIKGNSLEMAVEVYSELREAYDHISLDLKGLTYVNLKLSKLYQDLQDPDRMMPSYFKVCYIGLSFPLTMRGKEFIYQGLPFEQLSSIQDRLSRLHPGARILTKETEFITYQENIPNGKFMYINSVEPGTGFNLENSLVSDAARMYTQNRNLRHFVSVKRLPNSTSVEDLWSEEIIYETSDSFPTLMNRSEIKKVTLNKLSPFENAYRLMITRNHDLANIESSISDASRDQKDVSHYFGELSRQVTGTIDAPVNGGIGQYRVFFKEEYDKPEYQADVQKLKSAFNDMAMILDRCLQWHGKILPSPKLRENHLEILRIFKINFKPEIDSLGLTIRDTSDVESKTIARYNESIYSSDDDSNSNISRTRTNLSYSSGNSTDSSPTKLSTTSTNSSDSNLATSATNGTSSSNPRNSIIKLNTAKRFMPWNKNRIGSI